MILSFIGGFVLGIRRKGSPLVCLFRLTRLNSHEEGRDKQDAGKHSSQYSPHSSQRKYGEKASQGGCRWLGQISVVSQYYFLRVTVEQECMKFYPALKINRRNIDCNYFVMLQPRQWRAEMYQRAWYQLQGQLSDLIKTSGSPGQ